MKRLLYTLIVALLPLLWGCHDSKPGFLQDGEDAATEQGEGDDDKAGSDDEEADPGQRPGFVYDPLYALDSLAREPNVVGDKTTRYEGPTFTLRYATPGVMAKRTTTGKDLQLIDIDGNERIDWTPGRVEADSCLPEAVLEVNGARVVVEKAKLLKAEGGTRWYGIIEPQPDVYAPDQTSLIHLVVD